MAEYVGRHRMPEPDDTEAEEQPEAPAVGPVEAQPVTALPRAAAASRRGRSW